MERNNAARLDWYGFTGSGISARSRGLGPNLEVAKTRNLHVITVYQAVGDQVEECVEHVFRFPLVQPNLLKQQFGQMRFGKGGRFQAFNGKFKGRFLWHFLFFCMSGSHARLDQALQICNNSLNSRLNLFLGQCSHVA